MLLGDRPLLDKQPAKRVILLAGPDLDSGAQHSATDQTALDSEQPEKKVGCCVVLQGHFQGFPSMPIENQRSACVIMA